MAIRRMMHLGIVVGDLAAATAFVVELGLELQGDPGDDHLAGVSGRSRGRIRCGRGAGEVAVTR